MKPTQVLDHGYVRLVDCMGSDLSIVRAARVSYDADWRTGDDEGKDEKLIGYLMSNRHTTPFESVVFQWEIQAPIFVFRQWHRHRTWSFNEVSGRYTEMPELFYLPETDQLCGQSADNKQGRTTAPVPGADMAQQIMETQCRAAFAAYHGLLRYGVARELARSILPVNTYSRMFAKVDLHNLLKFIELRDHPHAQYEIQVYARAMLRLIEPIVPVTIAAWKAARTPTA